MYDKFCSLRPKLNVLLLLSAEGEKNIEELEGFL